MYHNEHNIFFSSAVVHLVFSQKCDIYWGKKNVRVLSTYAAWGKQGAAPLLHWSLLHYASKEHIWEKSKISSLWYVWYIEVGVTR